MDPKISAAMELLNAAAKEKKEDIRDLMSEKYSHLKNALGESPKDIVKENQWWALGGLALSALTVGLIVLLYRNQ